MGSNYYKVPEVTIEYGQLTDNFQFVGSFNRSIDILRVHLNGEHLFTLPEEAVDALVELLTNSKTESITKEEYIQLTNSENYPST